MLFAGVEISIYAKNGEQNGTKTRKNADNDAHLLPPRLLARREEGGERLLVQLHLLLFLLLLLLLLLAVAAAGAGAGAYRVC